MNPTIRYEIANARIAELRREAERDRAAREARCARKQHSGQPASRWIAGARRVLVLLVARGA